MIQRYTAEFHLQKFDGAIVGAMHRRYFPDGEITGRMISAPTQMYRIAPGDHWILIRCAEHHPYERNEIFAAVIRWHLTAIMHTPCRGGYQPPANVANLWAEPYWPDNVTML